MKRMITLAAIFALAVPVSAHAMGGAGLGGHEVQAASVVLAQYRDGRRYYRDGYDGPRVYGYRSRGYRYSDEPGYYGYNRGGFSRADRLPMGTIEWWAQMEREGRTGRAR